MGDKRKHVWNRSKDRPSFSDVKTAVDEGPTSLSDGTYLAATLEVVEGPDKGRLHIFDNNGGTIGRSGDADLMLEDPNLSRRHAEVIYDDGAFLLEDLGSTNGTRVDGVRIQGPVELGRRCRVHLGKHTAMDFTAVDLAGLDLAYQRMQGAARLRIQQEYSRRITRQAKRLTATVEDLELFTRSAAHDIRSPLQAILLTAQTLKETPAGQTSSQVRAMAGEIADTSRRIERLLAELSDYARMRHAPAKSEFVDLDRVVDEVLSNLSAAIQQSGAEIHRTELPEIVGHRELLVILMQNLLENAIKYRSAARPVVKIRASYDEPTWTITVEDNGIGLPLGDVSKLFEPFERAHAGDNLGGFGLGLALVRRAVEVHGGEIWAETSPTMGAAFHFTLPASMERWREHSPTPDPDDE